MGNHLLGQLHDVRVVDEGLVELEHRELGVVARRQTLVAEHAADLEHLLEAADDQPLEVQLERDAQHEVQVQRVVMGEERARGRAAGLLVQHRTFDLDVAAAREERTDRVERGEANLEDRTRALVDDQVRVPLAVARVDVREAVPLR